jgi:Ca-activated chloride channel family protein
MTVKLRYKKPDGHASKLLEVPVEGEAADLRGASGDFLFAAAVALFGEKLRESDKIGATSWSDVRDLAMRGAGSDRHGHRAEFLELVGLASERHPDTPPAGAPADPPERSAAAEAPPAE